MNRDLLIPINCTSFRMRQFSRLLARQYDAELAKAGLKTSQFSLLTLVANRGPISTGELAKRMGLSASTLTRNLVPLAANAWVEQVPGADGRVRTVLITNLGRNLQAQALSHWETAQRKVSEAMGYDNVRLLQTLVEDSTARLNGVING